MTSFFRNSIRIVRILFITGPATISEHSFGGWRINQALANQATEELSRRRRPHIEESKMV
jgi:hypothetical protein